MCVRVCLACLDFRRRSASTARETSRRALVSSKPCAPNQPYTTPQRQPDLAGHLAGSSQLPSLVRADNALSSTAAISDPDYVASISVSVEYMSDGRGQTLVMEDNGLGMNKEQVQKCLV